MDELIQNAVNEFKTGGIETPALEALQESDVPAGVYVHDGIEVTIHPSRAVSFKRL